MKNLIPMTDFVLSQNGYLTDCFKRSHNYAKFLKQPLELWMFVPCDDDGNVLKFDYPQNKAFVDVAQIEFEKQYQQAKERCLFEGFEFTKSQKFSMENKIKNSVHWYTKERLYLTTKKADGYHAYYQLFTVEDLIQCDLYLTQTAINIIGL